MENQTSNVILTLIDDINKIDINANKKILGNKCLYFEKLFTNFKEKDQDKITIQVPNVYVTCDIIHNLLNSGMSFMVCARYFSETTSEPTWCYLLDLLRCFDYLNILLPDLSSMINEILIPPEYFELLMDTVDSVGYNAITIEIIYRNLPEDYDILKFPSELINQLIKLSTTYELALKTKSDSVVIYNALTGIKIMNVILPFGLTKYYSQHNQLIHALTYKGWITFIYKQNHESMELKGYIAERFDVLACSSDNQLIAFGRENGTVNIWNANSGDLIHRLPFYIDSGKPIVNSIQHNGSITDVAFSPNNQHIASASADCTVKVWDLVNGKLIHTLIHNNRVKCVKYSPNNLFIISGQGNRITIWDVLTGNLIRTLTGHTNIINTVNYSFDGQFVVSGSVDETIKIWNASTGTLMDTIIGHKIPIVDVRYSPDDKLIISAGIDNSIKIWDTTTKKLIQSIDDNLNPDYRNMIMLRTKHEPIYDLTMVIKTNNIS